MIRSCSWRMILLAVNHCTSISIRNLVHNMKYLNIYRKVISLILQHPLLSYFAYNTNQFATTSLALGTSCLLLCYIVLVWILHVHQSLFFVSVWWKDLFFPKWIQPIRSCITNYSYRDDIPANNWAISCFVDKAIVTCKSCVCNLIPMPYKQQLLFSNDARINGWHHLTGIAPSSIYHNATQVIKVHSVHYRP